MIYRLIEREGGIYEEKKGREELTLYCTAAILCLHFSIYEEEEKSVPAAADKPESGVPSKGCEEEKTPQRKRCDSNHLKKAT